MGIGSNEAVERDEARWLEGKLKQYRLAQNDASIEDDDPSFREWIEEQAQKTSL